MGINISKVNGKSFRKKKIYFLLSRERQRKGESRIGAWLVPYSQRSSNKTIMPDLPDDYMVRMIIFSLQTFHKSGLKYNFQLIGIFLITERFYKFLIHFFPPRQVYKRNETPQILPIWWMNFTWEILKVIFLIIPPSECSGANF